MRLTRDHTPNPEQERLFFVALFITLAGNILLAVGKGIAAARTGSAALFADAANSVSDVFYSLLMVLGLWLALRPPDLSHPQGYSRFEPLVGLGIAVSMSIAGYEAGRTAIERFLSGGATIEPGLPLIVLVASAAVKVVMYISIHRLAQSLQNPTLETAARDNFNDVLGSLAVFIGTMGSYWLHPLADPITGLLVAAWIFRAAFQAARENLDFLTGAGASAEIRATIIQAALSVPGVLNVHHVMTEHVGPKLMVDVHINVDGDMPLTESHAINDQVIARIANLPNIDRAYVHLEPNDWTD